MRTRLILVLIFGASVYGVVFVSQHVANQPAPEDRSTLSDPTPQGTGSRVPEPDTGNSLTPLERLRLEGPREPAVAFGPQPVEAQPLSEVPDMTGLTEPEAVEFSPSVTAIEGYVFSQGRPVAGARVSWRPAKDSAYVPPSWNALPLDIEAVQQGSQVDLTTENPLNPGDFFPVRLGGGYRRYDTAIVRTFPTSPGAEYEVSVGSRYVHANWLGNIHGEGFRLNAQIGEFGVDLTGQTTNWESPTIRYQSVVDGPNNCWRRYRMRFQAEGKETSIWLHAKQLEAKIGLVWFDRLVVRPVASDEEGTDLLNAGREEEDGVRDYVASVLSGPQGRYRIEGIGPGVYDLRAVAEGKGSADRQRITVRSGKVTTADLNLLGAGVIRGKVLENIVGEPIQGAVVTAKLPTRGRENIEARNIPEEHVARTGPSGEFYMHGLLPGIGYHVTVECPGYVPRRVETVVPDGPEKTFALSPEGGVVGVVVEAGTDRPLEGAAVRVFVDQKRVAAAVTGEDGEFKITGLKSGAYRIMAEKNGRTSADGTGEITMIVLDSRTARAQVRLEIPRGGRLRGKAVEAESNQPIEGVDLIFTMVPVQPERSLVDAVFAELGVDVAGGGETPEQRLFQPRVCVRTDGQGNFEVANMAPGVWRRALRTDKYRFAGGPAQIPVVVGKQADIEVILRVSPSIEGFVFDQEGGPVVGAKVYPRRWTRKDGAYSYTEIFEEMPIGHSGPDGAFAIRGIDAGPSYDLVASAADGRMGLFEGARAGERQIEIVVQPFGSIEGRIRFESGKPLVGAKVSALGGELFGRHWWRDGCTDGEGRFVVEQLVTGSYDLDFGTRWPELHARYGPVRVEEGEEITGVDLVIPGNGRVSGKVIFPDDTGAPGILVTATKLDPDGEPRQPKHWAQISPNPLDDDREPELQFDIVVHQAYTDEVGDYAIGDLMPGIYQVVPSYPESLAPLDRRDDVQVEAQTITVGEGAVAGIDFVMGHPIVSPETEAETEPGGDTEGPEETPVGDSTVTF